MTDPRVTARDDDEQEHIVTNSGKMMVLDNTYRRASGDTFEVKLTVARPRATVILRFFVIFASITSDSARLLVPVNPVHDSLALVSTCHRAELVLSEQGTTQGSVQEIEK